MNPKSWACSHVVPNDKIVSKGVIGYQKMRCPRMRWQRIDQETSSSGTNKQEEMKEVEQELVERCWKGYTQKGMKTMFGKRYPNCVKKTK